MSVLIMISLGVIIGWNASAVFTADSNPERFFAIVQVVAACAAWWHIGVLSGIIRS